MEDNKNEIQLPDRKDVYVIRTLMFAFGDQEYFYWTSDNKDHLICGLRRDEKSVHLFEEKDKKLADRICELLNESQHEHFYEVVTFYDAWRCL